VIVAINGERLLSRLSDLAQIGTIPGDGVCRVAFTAADKQGRDRVKGWMSELGLAVREDAIGNVVGRMEGRDSTLAAVMMGSHIDTVATGGRLDGVLGVLAGLEVIQSCMDAGVRPLRSLEVGFFSNEEGCRFAPDMMGSLVYTGAFSLEEALAKADEDGLTVGQEMQNWQIGGSVSVPGEIPHAFVELHIEQGPVLEQENQRIGVVSAVQGISWKKLVLHGQSNHAGTAPIALRSDAGLVAAQITVALRELVVSMGQDMVGTVGKLLVSPNLVNVVPNRVEMTIDLRAPVEATLVQAEARLRDMVTQLCESEGVRVEWETLVRLNPVPFNAKVVDLIERLAREKGLSHRRMVSGAGHDAQIFAARTAAGMIFVPSIGGVSHNVEEATHTADLLAGCQLLSDSVWCLAEELAT
jgi:beta-ureidopropionase / N-carbamoyl-L-amino-acid hydrolase